MAFDFARKVLTNDIHKIARGVHLQSKLPIGAPELGFVQILPRGWYGTPLGDAFILSGDVQVCLRCVGREVSAALLLYSLFDKSMRVIKSAAVATESRRPGDAHVRDLAQPVAGAGGRRDDRDRMAREAGAEACDDSESMARELGVELLRPGGGAIAAAREPEGVRITTPDVDGAAGAPSEGAEWRAVEATLGSAGVAHASLAPSHGNESRSGGDAAAAGEGAEWRATESTLGSAGASQAPSQGDESRASGGAAQGAEWRATHGSAGAGQAPSQGDAPRASGGDAAPGEWRAAEATLGDAILAPLQAVGGASLARTPPVGLLLSETASKALASYRPNPLLANLVVAIRGAMGIRGAERQVSYLCGVLARVPGCKDFVGREARYVADFINAHIATLSLVNYFVEVSQQLAAVDLHRHLQATSSLLTLLLVMQKYSAGDLQPRHDASEVEFVTGVNSDEIVHSTSVEETLDLLELSIA